MIWRKVIPDLHGLLWLLENGLKKKKTDNQLKVSTKQAEYGLIQQR